VTVVGAARLIGPLRAIACPPGGAEPPQSGNSCSNDPFGSRTWAARTANIHVNAAVRPLKLTVTEPASCLSNTRHPTCELSSLGITAD
jgi:hypothetical protein